MNQLDLILENIRLGHINALLLEAKTEDEVQRGVNLINESMQLLAGSLMEEMAVHANHPALNKNNAGYTRYQGHDIKANRTTLASDLHTLRSNRDISRNDANIANAQISTNNAAYEAATPDKKEYSYLDRKLFNRGNYQAQQNNKRDAWRSFQQPNYDLRRIKDNSNQNANHFDNSARILSYNGGGSLPYHSNVNFEKIAPIQSKDRNNTTFEDTYDTSEKPRSYNMAHQ